MMSLPRKALFTVALLAGFAASALAVETNAPSHGVSAASKSLESLEAKWGIRISSIFVSGSGNLVDFRYRVIDPSKAAALTKPELKPMLISQKTGAKLIVPSSPKVGPMRQTVKLPVAGKVYFMMFANTRHQVKSGDKVTVVAGDFRAENLTVE